MEEGMTMTTASPEMQAADVFVIFGITGDLAKVMTFRSLYRLEARGLLDCPIVGVAVDDWSVDQLVQRARESIEGTVSGSILTSSIDLRRGFRTSAVTSLTARPMTGSAMRFGARTIRSSTWRFRRSCSRRLCSG